MSNAIGNPVYFKNCVLILFLIMGELGYLMQLWQIHVAEQTILDDWEANPEKYKGKKISELTDNEDFDEENSIEYTEAYHKKTVLPKVILVRNILW